MRSPNTGHCSDTPATSDDKRNLVTVHRIYCTSTAGEKTCVISWQRKYANVMRTHTHTHTHTKKIERWQALEKRKVTLADCVVVESFTRYGWRWHMAEKQLAKYPPNDTNSVFFILSVYILQKNLIIRGSFNKYGELYLRSSQLNAIYTVSRKSLMIDPFIYQKTVSMTFFTDCCTWNLFFVGELVRFYFMDYLFLSGS